MSTCTITGTITLADGSPAISQQVKASIQSAKDDQGGQLVAGVGVTSDPIEAFTDATGAFAIDLIQGSTVLFEIPTINLSKEIVVPTVPTANFSTLV